MVPSWASALRLMGFAASVSQPGWPLPLLRPSASLRSNIGCSTRSLFLRPTPKLSVRQMSSMMRWMLARSSLPGMSRRTALLPQAMSKPTAVGLMRDSEAMTPPMGTP